ncbi:hypothetical protein ILUMI_22309 [Ignelater luminosus]|uniref:Uncharacterized protein n=1 Tax=Ignelater luminosus TaxID=2038154 RepID=A0A8K0CD06_IGNLU|nr:hypothetical protein ILUMI_22309 [Ignelater luminosus]
MIFVHTATTFLLKVPGRAREYLGPGGLHKLGHYGNCTVKIRRTDSSGLDSMVEVVASLKKASISESSLSP